MICFAFPLAHEAELMLKHCTEKESFTIDGLRCTVANLARRRVLVALVGMGEAAATDNTATIFQHFKLRAVILGGYGGALVPALKVGQVVVSNNFSTEAVLGFLRMFSGFDFATFCQVDEIAATPEQRDHVAQVTGAGLRYGDGGDCQCGRVEATAVSRRASSATRTIKCCRWRRWLPGSMRPTRGRRR